MKTNREPTPAQLDFDKPRASKECSPKNRMLHVDMSFPVVVNFDLTDNGMCDLPQFFWDDASNFVENGRLMVPALFKDLPTFYFTGVGDIKYDSAPVQVTNGAAFTVKDIRHELAKLWLEKGGGGGTDIENLCESYEMMAYWLVNRFEMDAKRIQNSVCIFVADEAMRPNLDKAELDYYFGGTNAPTTAAVLFEQLRKKFNENVFLIFRPSFDAKKNAAIMAHWQEMLSENKIVVLPRNRLITTAIQETIRIALGATSTAEVQKQLNELAATMPLPKREKSEPATENQSNPIFKNPLPEAPFADSSQTTIGVNKPLRKPRPSDDWRLQPKTKERPARSTSRKRKTPAEADAFRL